GDGYDDPQDEGKLKKPPPTDPGFVGPPRPGRFFVGFRKMYRGSFGSREMSDKRQGIHAAIVVYEEGDNGAWLIHHDGDKMVMKYVGEEDVGMMIEGERLTLYQLKSPTGDEGVWVQAAIRAGKAWAKADDNGDVEYDASGPNM